MRPGMTADVHACIHPDVQSLLRIGIILKLHCIHKAIGAFHVIGLELSR